MLSDLSVDDDHANRLETEQQDGYFIARLILAADQAMTGNED